MAKHVKQKVPCTPEQRQTIKAVLKVHDLMDSLISGMFGVSAHYRFEWLTEVQSILCECSNRLDKWEDRYNVKD